MLEIFIDIWCFSILISFISYLIRDCTVKNLFSGFLLIYFPVINTIFAICSIIKLFKCLFKDHKTIVKDLLNCFKI